MPSLELDALHNGIKLGLVQPEVTSKAAESNAVQPCYHKQDMQNDDECDKKGDKLP